MSATETPSLANARAQIDAIDLQLVALLNQRAEYAIQVSKHKLKKSKNTPLYDPSRESKIKQKLLCSNNGPFPTEQLTKVFTEIISGCLRLEQIQTIGYLGPAGSYTQAAAISHFGSAAVLHPWRSIADIFDALARDENHYAVLPIENSTAGTVAQTIDYLHTHSTDTLQIIGETEVIICHCLLAAYQAKLADITDVYAHPQASAQCSRWLAKSLPHAKLHERASNSAAAQYIKDKPHAAAIAGITNAQLYGLHIIQENISDIIGNRTRFIVLGKQQPAPTGHDKTALVFSVSHRSGGLYEALRIFREHKINMSMLASHPSPDSTWTYSFYCEFSGHIAADTTQQLLHSLHTEMPLCKLLGSFPAWVDTTTKQP